MNSLDDGMSRVREGVHGARAAYLVGLDGLVVACAPPEAGAEGDRIGAWWADLLRRAGDAGREAGTGRPTEVAVASEAGTILSRPVAGDHAIVVLLEPGAVLGRARFELRREADRIASDLES